MEHKQVPKRGTEPGVRKGKRSLLACNIHCNCFKWLQIFLNSFHRHCLPIRIKPYIITLQYMLQLDCINNIFWYIPIVISYEKIRNAIFEQVQTQQYYMSYFARIVWCISYPVLWFYSILKIDNVHLFMLFVNNDRHIISHFEESVDFSYFSYRKSNFFVALFVLSLCPFDIFVGVGAFVIGLSQISSFFSWCVNHV